MHGAQRQNHHVQSRELQHRVTSLLRPGFGSGLQPRTKILSSTEEGLHTEPEPGQCEDCRPVRATLLLIKVKIAG